MKLMLLMCIPFGITGCLQDAPLARPGPSDQGVERMFDARPPTAAPSGGSGYGSGYSGNAPYEAQDASLTQDSEAADAQENVDETQEFE